MKRLFILFCMVGILSQCSYAETSSQELQRIIKSFEIYPTHWLPHIHLAKFYLEQGSIPLAFNTLKDASLKFPDNLKLKQELANFYKQLGQSQEALRIYQDLKKRFPENQTVQLKYIALLIEFEYIEQAEEELDKLLENQPYSVRGLFLWKSAISTKTTGSCIGLFFTLCKVE